MSFNYKVIIKIAGIISIMVGISMFLPLIVSLIYHETHSTEAFLKSMVLSFGLGIAVFIFNKPESTDLKIRDGYFIAALCWFLASFLGAFPYYFSDMLPTFGDCYFESVSGFTTTGSTIIYDFSALPKAMQFWRSFSHWLGAIGILILAISLLPALGIGGMKIASAEAPGPTVQKMSTRIADSSRMLYLIYISFTFIEIILLMLGGLNLFDALIHTFGSIGTGGISTYKEGISHFNSFYVEFIIILFSIIASINFTLYHQVLNGKWGEFIKNKELRAFFSILISSTLLIALVLKISMPEYSFFKALRDSIFQTTAFMSTSGYTTTDYTLWPSFCQMLLLCLMIIGGCSASTSGSMKVIRIIVLFKLIIRGIYKRLHPNAVYSVKVGGSTLSAETVSKVSSFTFVYFSILMISMLVVSLENHDFLTTITAASSALSNTGMGLGLLGPSGNFSIFSLPTRLYLSVVMIAGRLELFTIIMLISPSFWKSK